MTIWYVSVYTVYRLKPIIILPGHTMRYRHVMVAVTTDFRYYFAVN